MREETGIFFQVFDIITEGKNFFVSKILSSIPIKYEISYYMYYKINT